MITDNIFLSIGCSTLNLIMFYTVLQEGYNVKTVIQKYGNICKEAEEYHPSAMLICPPNGHVQCMPTMPIVAHHQQVLPFSCRAQATI